MARTRPAVPCTARRSRDGQPCRCYAIVGGTVCRMHGGAAPQVRLQAEARRVLAVLTRRTPALREWVEAAASRR